MGYAHGHSDWAGDELRWEDRALDAPLDTIATVETPERVRFRYRLAGPGRRAVAYGIDLGVRFAIVAVFTMILATFSCAFSGLGLSSLAGMGTGSLLVLLFVLEWFYGSIFETLLSGRTPGKLALSLRVVREDGSPAAMPDYVLRNLMRAADYLPGPFGVAILSMTIDPSLRRLGDFVGGTVVVVEERETVRTGVVIEPPVTDDERQALPPRVDLRRDELDAIEALLRRRTRLTAERVEELAAILGPTIADRTGVDAPTWERVLTLAYARATGKDR